jgi:hypothetical protein
MKRAKSQRQLQTRYQALQKEWLAIVRAHPQADPDNVWHTLVSLEQSPTERVQVGLLRGRANYLSRN